VTSSRSAPASSRADVTAGGPTRWLRPATSASRRFLDKPFASTQLMLLAGLGLLAFGLMMATSTTISASLQAGSHQTMWAQVQKEAEFLILGIPVFWVAVRVPPRIYRVIAYPALLLGVVALLAVLVPGIGVQINSAHRWLSLGPLQLQPSEFVKIAILLWGADLLTRKLELRTLGRARHLFVPLVPGFGLICVLLMLEPDLGTTLCFLLILFGLLWTVGTPFRYFLLLVTMAGCAVAALAYTAPYRLARLTAFTDPFKHAQDSGLQTVQGLYALASGGLFGVGLGASTAKYSWLPNANTDYVFAVIGEETGLLGCLVVLALFTLFAFTGLRISRRSADPFARLVAGGATVWICGQAVINVGYVTDLLPVTGIPLPFISAGGTSLLATSVVFGMLVSFARHEPAAVRFAAQQANDGRRGRVQRWCRMPVPRDYQAPTASRKVRRAPPERALRAPAVPVAQTPRKRPPAPAPARPRVAGSASARSATVRRASAVDAHAPAPLGPRRVPGTAGRSAPPHAARSGAAPSRAAPSRAAPSRAAPPQAQPRATGTDGAPRRPR
jgi:cell division protein FtsW